MVGRVEPERVNSGPRREGSRCGPSAASRTPLMVSRRWPNGNGGSQSAVARPNHRIGLCAEARCAKPSLYLRATRDNSARAEPLNDPTSDPLPKGRGMICTYLHSALAQARVDDLRRAADRHRLARLASPWPRLAPAAERSVTLRFGSPADRHGIARLAELDGSGAPAHPVLVAEVHGQLLAALALSDGSVVANPFHRTADLIDLLRARARQLDGGRRPRRSLRWRPWSRRVVAARR